jgi:NNP family nitrate/nitrite transporter-like MFS transporter
MDPKSSSRPGHLPTIFASFLHFDLSFMLWVMVGSLGIYIAKDLNLQPAQKGLLVAVPLLGGSILRFPMGFLVDRFGGKRVGVAMFAFYFLPLFLGWRLVHNMSEMICVGLLLGTSGASFAVALPLASRWYPPERQGLVMGVAAAGNSGTVVANLLAPPLANIYGWHSVFALAMLPTAAGLLIFLFLAKENPHLQSQPKQEKSFEILKMADLWRFCLFYSITFGGFVGLSSFLPIYFRDQFHVSPLHAGQLTALMAMLGSSVRPIGGYLADKVGGGVRVLVFLLLGVGTLYLLISASFPLLVTVAMILVTMVCLGLGNGAIFQVVPQRFSERISIATGVIGASGGLGGFLLPTLLGSVKQLTGSFKFGFLALAILCISATFLLFLLIRSRIDWRGSFLVSRSAAAFQE